MIRFLLLFGFCHISWFYGYKVAHKINKNLLGKDIKSLNN